MVHCKCKQGQQKRLVLQESRSAKRVCTTLLMMILHSNVLITYVVNLSDWIQLHKHASYSYCARSWPQQTNPSRKKNFSSIFYFGILLLKNWLRLRQQFKLNMESFESADEEELSTFFFGNGVFNSPKRMKRKRKQRTSTAGVILFRKPSG